MEFMIFVLLLMILDLTALRWGADSRDWIAGPKEQQCKEHVFFL